MLFTQTSVCSPFLTKWLFFLLCASPPFATSVILGRFSLSNVTSMLGPLHLDVISDLTKLTTFICLNACKLKNVKHRHRRKVFTCYWRRVRPLARLGYESRNVKGVETWSLSMWTQMTTHSRVWRVPEWTWFAFPRASSFVYRFHFKYHLKSAFLWQHVAKRSVT